MYSNDLHACMQWMWTLIRSMHAGVEQHRSMLSKKSLFQSEWVIPLPPNSLQFQCMLRFHIESHKGLEMYLSKSKIDLISLWDWGSISIPPPPPMHIIIVYVSSFPHIESLLVMELNTTCRLDHCASHWSECEELNIVNLSDTIIIHF